MRGAGQVGWFFIFFDESKNDAPYLAVWEAITTCDGKTLRSLVTKGGLESSFNTATTKEESFTHINRIRSHNQQRRGTRLNSNRC